MTTRGALAQRALPRQKSVETQHADMLELVHLAGELSEKAARRQRNTPRDDNGQSVILPFPTTHRRPSLFRRLFVPVTLLVAAAVVALLALSMSAAPSAPAAPAPPAPAPVAAAQPMSPAQTLGQAAGRRLTQGGGLVDDFICTSAYIADAQIAANGLPPTSARSAAQAEYLSACMSAM
jgi:hypothetical protein